MRATWLLMSMLLAHGAIAAPAREPVVGLPCEGCEAVFEGLPATIANRSRIAPAGEPGAPMVLSGTVVDAQGRPRPGIVVYAYQTDAAGVYPPDPSLRDASARRHGRLRGWARTDASGAYAFDTIRPGSYPGQSIPEHIHLHVIEPGCSTYYIDDVMFTDDPKLTPRQRAGAAHGRGGNGIVTPVRDGEGWRVRRDIRLGENVPGHAACPP